jgi:trehalose 6-phosphate phosphatase
LAKGQTLCAFDFDGTLAPIVERPNQAGMRVRTRKLLSGLAELYPCIIVSGRARSDVLGKLRGVGVAGVIGNHGAEVEGTQRHPHGRRVAKWNAALKRELSLFPGVWVEDKGLSLAVHYRQSTEKAEVRRRILAVARNLEHVRVFGGKQVVNLVPDRAPQKGDALASERDRLGCSDVLYVGDDENDEHAFAIGGNLVSVRIGNSPRSHADYYLRTQAEMDQLLKLMIDLRKSHVALGAAPEVTLPKRLNRLRH